MNRVLVTGTGGFIDAEAICEALTRPSMRFVPIKNQAQQDMQALHRVREQLIKDRTALVNQIRGCASTTSWWGKRSRGCGAPCR